MAEPWEPKADKDQTRETVIKYRLQPELWNGKDKEITELKKHAEYHRVPFARSKQHQDGMLTGIVKQLGKGWAEGFSANILQSDDEPETTVEGFARQLGNLGGFIGYIPAARFLGPLRALSKFTRGKSIPLRAATGVSNIAKKMGPTVQREMPSVGKLFRDESMVGDVIGGAFHLGVASAVSDWRGIVAEGAPRALESAGVGAVMGGGMRGLGNLKFIGKRLTNAQVDPSTGLPIMSKLEPGQATDIAIRSVVSGLTASIYANSQGAPTEQQVYEFIMGSVFQFNDTPLQLRLSRKAIFDTIKNDYGVEDRGGKVPDPELHPDWDTWTPEAQNIIKKDFDAWFGTDPETKAVSFMLHKQAMKNEGVKESDMNKMMDEMVQRNIESMEVAPDGDIIDPVTRDEIKKAKDVIKDNPNSEEYQDLDLHVNELENLPGKIAGGRGYVDKYIMSRIKSNSATDRLVQSLKISKKWDELHHRVQGVSRPKEGAVDVMLDFIQKEYGVKDKDISQKEQDWWRNWAEQTRKKRLVLQTYFVDGKVAYVDKGVSPLGTKKELAFEPPEIQTIYDNLNATEGKAPENFYTIADFFVRKGKEYGFKASDVKRLQADLRKEAKGGKPVKAENVIKQVKSKIVKELDNAGYYYVGGRGDKPAMYFVKKHPFFKNVDDGMKLVKDAMVKSGRMTPREFEQYVLKASRKYSMKYRGMNGADYYMRSLINNVMYDVHNNFGARVTREQMLDRLIQMAKNDGGYIKDAKGYNKRAQIWFNSGQTTNQNVAKRFLNGWSSRFRKQYKLGKDFEPLEFTGRDKNFGIKMAVWDDSLGIKKDDFRVDRKNMERPEGFDGGIPALPEFIYALNKANGLTNEGKVNKSFILSPDARYGAMMGKYMFFEASPALQKVMRQRKIHALAPASGIKQMGERSFAQLFDASKIKTMTTSQYQNAVRDLLAGKGRFINAEGVMKEEDGDLVPKYSPERIGSIYIKPEHRGKGLGSKVANLIEQHKRGRGLKEIEIEAIGGRKRFGTEDLDNIDFWKKQGYVVTGEAKKFTFPKNANVLDPRLPGKTIFRIPMKKDITSDFMLQGPSYEVPLKHIRTVLSETTSVTDLDKAKFAKQMWTTIMHFGKNKTSPKLIKQMGQELIRGSVVGDDTVNKNWDAHVKNPNPVSERQVLQDIDSVSLDRLMRSVTDTNDEAFASKVYDAILKRNNATTREGTEEAEYMKDEYYQSINEVTEFESILDRVGELYPDGNLGFYMHKFAKNYRQNAVKNYIVDRISRPVLKNGMKARMRPWDPGMWTDKKLKEINENQDIFFLDDGAKAKKIYDPIFPKGYDTLGNIWKGKQDKSDFYTKNKEYIDDVLEAVNMRVPMDSQSGAHVLKFAGFTGTNGHGVLLHGRSMEALGGADLDGDKAFIFFGGKSGIWKEWKDIYRDQKDEFTDKDKNVKPAKTKEARDKFVKKDEDIDFANKQYLSKYDPELRTVMSEAAAEGRETLGGAVTTKQALGSAYDVLKLSKKTTYGPVQYIKGKYLPVIIQKGNFYYPTEIDNKVVYVQQRPKDKGVQRFKELSKAAINLGADPMDEAGIVSFPEIQNILRDSLFEYKFMRFKEIGKGADKKYIFTRAYDLNRNTDYHRDLIKKQYNKGLDVSFSIANNVLYGRNTQTGRKYSLGEIQNGINSITWLPKRSQRNLLNMISEEYRQIPYEDNIFRRLDRASLENLYNYNREQMTNNSELMGLMERTSMMSRMGPMVDNIIKNKIYDFNSRIALANNKERFWDLFSREWHPQFDAEQGGKKRYEMGRIPSHLYYSFVKDRKNVSRNQRLQYLEYKLNQAEDYIVNDLSDMASIKHIMDVKSKYDISDEEFKTVNKLVSSLKNSSYWVKKSMDELKENLKEVARVEGEPLPEDFLKRLELRTKISSGKTQQEIDTQIFIDKKSLKKKGLQDLYDSMLLGTFQRTNLDLIKRLENKTKLSKAQQMFLETLRKHGQNTSLLRLGFLSKGVKDTNVKTHLKEYDNLYKVINEPSKQEKDMVDEVAKGDEKHRSSSYLSELGKPVEGKVIESSDLSEADRFYMDQIEPFKNLQKGDVKDKELLEVGMKIKGHMQHYHNMDTRAFNGLFRNMFQKNINQANKQDLMNFERFLSDMRKGSTWTRMMSWLKGGPDKRPEIERRYWNRFPEANQREWLKYPGMVKWAKDVAPYKDRFNNSIMGEVVKPTTVIGDIQNFAWKGAEYSLQTSEEEINGLRDELAPFTQALEDGNLLHKIAISNRERGMVHLLNEVMGDDPALMQKQRQYMDNYNEMQPHFTKVKDKIYKVPTVKGEVNMRGEEIIDAINEIYTRKNREVASYINGDVDWIENFIGTAYNKQGNLTWSGLDKFYNKYLRYAKEKFRKGEKFDIKKMGINGIQEVNKLVALKFTPRSERSSRSLKQRAGELGIGLKFTDTWDANHYFPHVSFDRKNVDVQLSKALDAVFADKKTNKNEKFEAAKKLIYQSKTMTGDWAPKSVSEENFDIMQEIYSATASQERAKGEKILPLKFKKAYSQYQREAHLGGWSREAEAYEQNMRNLIDSFYKEGMLTLSRSHIQDFYRKFLRQTKDKKLTTNWANFLKLYTQSSMGYPVDIPESIQNDPSMKIGLTPYKWFADNNARNRIDSIRKTLGISSKALKKYEVTDKDILELNKYSQSQLQYWSGLEAKWQMASLLAHPKSAATNLFGGQVHTAISAGLSNLRKARNIDYLKTNVNPNWRSMRDVEKWVESLGIVEEFLLYEAGLNKEIRGRRFKEFLNDAVQKIKRNPEYSDTDLRALARKYKVTDSMWNKASWFMRRPERTLRRDAFIAHYIQAKENFGGAIRDYNHPFLIEMGRKGVKATQFLYSAPFRPMWTNSAMGRVMSRFQLWSWNSVRFRKDLLQEAKLRGFTPGTPSYERAKRLVQADLMVYGLSSMFMYSLFDNALPAPWNWFQDVASQMFGDDKERERAFFGHPAGVLSIVKPPILRFDQPLYEGLVNGQWDKMTDYYLYTLLPFGRIIKDVVGPGGAIENPFYAVEKFTGLPYIQGGNFLQDAKEGDKDSKGIFADLY